MKETKRKDKSADTINHVNVEIYRRLVGRKIEKKSKKPFKSGEKVGVPTDVVAHDHLIDVCAYLMDDGSVVRCSICKEYVDEK